MIFTYFYSFNTKIRKAIRQLQGVFRENKKMSCAAALLDGNAQPKSMSRARQWTHEVENLYRFQQAGYRDEMEYRQIKQVEVK